MLRLPFVLFVLFCFTLTACGAEDGPVKEEEPVVLSGAARLAADGFRLLDGKRVGLVTNHTALVDSVHLIDLLHEAPNVELAALFGPEHGLRGIADAGDHVGDEVDPSTGIPVYSLYGARRAPSVESLEGLDALLFDIQDIGARFYTYISTMGLSMQAAAAAGVPFIVLDRPNPLGGTYMAGFVAEKEFESFVGQYPIPTAHGLTVGELARMIQGEAWLPGLEQLELTVIEVDGWTRSMCRPNPELPWIKPSPNIPSFETALLYPGTCIFEGVNLSEGRGTLEPFLVIGGPWVDGASLAAGLNGLELPGLLYESVAFTPESIQGMSSSPKLLGVASEGVRHLVVDPDAVQPVEAGVHLLHALYQAAPETARADFFLTRTFDRLAGTDRLRMLLADGASPDEIIAAWAAEVEAFAAQRARYLLY